MNFDLLRFSLLSGVLTLGLAGPAWAQYQVVEIEEDASAPAPQVEQDDANAEETGDAQAQAIDAAEEDESGSAAGEQGADDAPGDAADETTIQNLIEDDAALNLEAEADAEPEILVTAPEVPEEDVEALAACRTGVEAFMAERAILFGSGSARLVAQSEADLADVADILALCPAAPVYVEGHTDSDGGDAANLILSVSRAEAVIEVLTDLGISPDRLYAVGYGASLPVASNATAAGKAQNRRIVFSFEDIAESVEDSEP